MKLSQSKFGIIKAPTITGDRNWGMNYTNLNNLYAALTILRAANS